MMPTTYAGVEQWAKQLDTTRGSRVRHELVLLGRNDLARIVEESYHWKTPRVRRVARDLLQRRRQVVHAPVRSGVKGKE